MTGVTHTEGDQQQAAAAKKKKVKGSIASKHQSVGACGATLGESFDGGTSNLRLCNTHVNGWQVCKLTGKVTRHNIRRARHLNLNFHFTSLGYTSGADVAGSMLI